MPREFAGEFNIQYRASVVTLASSSLVDPWPRGLAVGVESTGECRALNPRKARNVTRRPEARVGSVRPLQPYQLPLSAIPNPNLKSKG